MMVFVVCSAFAHTNSGTTVLRGTTGPFWVCLAITIRTDARQFLSFRPREREKVCSSNKKTVIKTVRIY